LSPSVELSIRDGVALLDATGVVNDPDLDALLQEARTAAFAAPDVRRVETLVSAEDWPLRRALHRAGFRLDGVLRDRLPGGGDQCHYALLRADSVDDRHAFTAVMNTVTARKRVIAHLLLTDEHQRVCVLETTFKPDFELPGGIVEPGESPREAVLRESEEEVGIAVSVGPLLVVDWLAPYLGWEDAVELVFDGGTCFDPASLVPDGREIRAAHWLSAEDAVATMAPFAQGRFRAALAARQQGRTLYLEAGQQIS
jgi:8-oxo-dGTP pyrophosphatase MutT (NUDIX family)